MELRDIEYFSVVAKHGNLGRAAEALGLSQSALSKSLRRLEREMRAKMVKRTSKGVELTAEGVTLLARTQRLRLSLDDVRREIADVSRGLAGHLRVGAGSGWANHLLPAACAALVRDAPKVTMSVKFPGGQSESLKALRGGDVDFVITMFSASPVPDLVQEYLIDDEYVVCASPGHALAKKKIVTLADVAQERWVLPEPTFALWQHFHRVFEEHGLPTPHVTLETGPQALRYPLIASSDLLGYTWASLVRSAMPRLRLAELRVKELTSGFRGSVVYRREGYLSPAAKRFIEILKTTAKTIVAGG